MQRWTVTEGVSSSEGAEGYPVYGVQVTLPDGTEWGYPDVDVERAVAEQLAHRLQALQPEACHFRDLVLDYIEEMAGNCEKTP